MRAASLIALGVAVLAVSAAQAGSDPLADQIARGHRVAQTNCSGCHAVETTGVSYPRKAPPFRLLSGKYVELTLHMKLTEIAETGHYDMPAMPVHSDQIRDLAAYINSLDPAAPPR